MSSDFLQEFLFRSSRNSNAKSLRVKSSILNSHCKIIDPITVSENELIKWFVAEKGRLSDSYLALTVSVTRRFYAFLCENDYRKDDLSGCLTVPKVSSKRKIPPSAADVLSVLAQFGDSDYQRRACLITMTLFGCGLRISEALTLDIEDIDFSKKILSVQGKGNKLRHVPIPSKLFVELQDWIGSRREGKIFETDDLGTISRNRYADHLADAAARAGFDPKKFHPHALRHAYATTLMVRDVSTRKVQRLLGHSNLAMTERYTNVIIDDLLESVERMHPFGDPASAAVCPHCLK